jgi:hypothetical protein
LGSRKITDRDLIFSPTVREKRRAVLVIYGEVFLEEFMKPHIALDIDSGLKITNGECARWDSNPRSMKGGRF